MSDSEARLFSAPINSVPIPGDGTRFRSLYAPSDPYHLISKGKTFSTLPTKCVHLSTFFFANDRNSTQIGLRQKKKKKKVIYWLKQGKSRVGILASGSCGLGGQTASGKAGSRDSKDVRICFASSFSSLSSVLASSIDSLSLCCITMAFSSPYILPAQQSQWEESLFVK